MNCGVNVTAKNGNPSMLFRDLVEATQDIGKAYKVYLLTKTKNFKDWMDRGTKSRDLYDANGEVVLVDGYFYNGDTYKSTDNDGSFGKQFTNKDVLGWVQEGKDNIVTQRLYDGDYWIKAGITIDGVNQQTRNWNRLNKTNEIYYGMFNEPLYLAVPTITEPLRYRVKVNESVLDQMNEIQDIHPLYAKVADIERNIRDTVINLPDVRLTSLNAQEEAYAVNVLTTFVKTRLSKFTDLSMRDAMEGTTVKSLLMGDFRELNNYLYENQSDDNSITKQEYAVNNKILAELALDNVFLWNKVKNSILFNTGYYITELNDMEYDPNDIENQFDDTKQFAVPYESRLSSVIRDFISDVPDYSNNENERTPGGIPMMANVIEVLPVLVQNLGSAVNVSAMLDKLQSLSHNRPMYGMMFDMLSEDENMRNLFFSTFKSESPYRIFNEFTKGEKEDVSIVTTDIKNRNSYNWFQIADSIITSVESKVQTNFYKDRDLIDRFNELYKDYHTLVGDRKLNRLAEIFNTLGIPITSANIQAAVKDPYTSKLILEEVVDIESFSRLYNEEKTKQDKQDAHRTTTIIDTVFARFLFNLDEYVNGKSKTFDVYGYTLDIGRFLAPYINPTTISYVNVVGNQQQSYNKPTFIGDWFTMMKDDTMFLEHLKKMALDPKVRYSNWLFNTKKTVNGVEIGHDGFINLPEGVTNIRDIDRTNIEGITLNKDFYYDKAKNEYLFDYFFYDGFTDKVNNRAVEYQDVDVEDWRYVNIINYFHGNNISSGTHARAMGAGNFALHALLNPADRGHNRFVSTPRFTINTDDLDSVGMLKRDSEAYKAVARIFMGELNRATEAYNDIYKPNKDGVLVPSKFEDLIEGYHYKVIKGKRTLRDSSGRLVGSAFQLYHFSYMDSNGATHHLTDLLNDYIEDNNPISNLLLRDEHAINGIVRPFIDRMLSNMVLEQMELNQVNIKAIMNVAHKYDKLNYIHAITDYTVNNFIANVEFVNFFLGDLAFYGDSKDANKRGAELLANGIVDANYGTDLSFYGVVANDKIVNSRLAKDIYSALIATGVNEQTATTISDAYTYIESTDGISFITLDEYEKRLKARGLWDRYESIINKARNNEALNIDELSDFINSQKNFYFDYSYNRQYDKMIPTQVKNSEVVLIPAFIKKGSELELINQFLLDNEIGQLNFTSTEKVGTTYAANLFNKDGSLSKTFNRDLIKSKKEYYYRSLRKQQDIVNHILDETNKHGVQFRKKITDNLHDSTIAAELHELESTNIDESYENLLKRLNIQTDTSFEGKTVYGIDNAQLSELIIQRLTNGTADSNALYGAMLDEDGEFRLPIDLLINSRKNESILTALFNNSVIRQTFPGVHGPQVSNVFMQDIAEKSGIKRKSELPTSGDLHYQRFVNKDGTLEFIEAEVYMPYWSKGMFKHGITIEQLQEAGLDIMIGYRIPTENKNSMFVFKVKGFLSPLQGSSIVVPPEFITQTGADFDIDSIYTMYYNYDIKPNGEINKVQYVERDPNEYKTVITETETLVTSADQLDFGKTTATDNVEIDNFRGRKPAKGDEIIAYRTRRAKNEQEFITELTEDNAIGNPWSHAGYSVFKSSTIKEAVLDFANWLMGTGHTDVYQDYRQAILDKLPELKGKKIVYYRNLNQPSHATVLDFLLNNEASPLNKGVIKTTKVTETRTVSNEVAYKLYKDFVYANASKAQRLFQSERLKELANARYQELKDEVANTVKEAREIIGANEDKFFDFIKAMKSDAKRSVLDYAKKLNEFRDINKEPYPLAARIELLQQFIDKQIELYTNMTVEDGIKLNKKFNDIFKDYITMRELIAPVLDSIKELDNVKDDANQKLIDTMYSEHWEDFKDHIAEGLIPFSSVTFEEFKQYDTTKQNSKRARQNRMLDIYIKVLSDPANYLEMASPNTMNHTVEARDLSTNFYDSFSNVVNYASPTTQDIFRTKAQWGRKLKGIAVARNGALSIAQSIGLHTTSSNIRYKFNIGKPITYNINGREIVLPAYTLEQLKEYFGEDNVLFDGTVTLTNFGKNAKGTFENIDGHLIMSYASESIAHILDNVKEELPNGISMETAPTWIMLTELGGSWNFSTLLHDQEAISYVNQGANRRVSITVQDTREALYYAKNALYIELLKNAILAKDESVVKLGESLKKAQTWMLDKAIKGVNDLSIATANNFLIGAYMGVMDGSDIPRTVLSEQYLIKQLQDRAKLNTFTPEQKMEYYKNQINILATYTEYNNISEQYNDFITTTSFDRKPIGPDFASINDMLSLIDKIQSTRYKGVGNTLVDADGVDYITSIYTNNSYPVLKKFKENGIDAANNIFSKLFITQAPTIKAFINTIPNHMRSKMLTYIVNSNLKNLPFFRDTNLVELFGLEHQDISDIDLSQYTEEMIDKYSKLSVYNKLELVKQHYNQYINPNNVLYYLQTVATENYLKYNNHPDIRFISDKSSDILIDSFAELWYNSDMYLHLLAKDLVKFAFFEKNFTFGYNVSKIIPASILHNEAILVADKDGNNDELFNKPIIKGIGFTSYSSKIRNEHFSNEFYNPYDNVFRYNFSRKNWNVEGIVPTVEMEMEMEDGQKVVKSGAIPWTKNLNLSRKNTISNQIIEVKGWKFKTLPLAVQQADVVKVRKEINGTPSYQLWAKVVKRDGYNMQYYYVPVTRLSNFDYDTSTSIIPQFNNPSIAPLDTYLRLLDVITESEYTTDEYGNDITSQSFHGYVGPHQAKGKGTPIGSGADVAMRKVATNFIGEARLDWYDTLENSTSSTQTSALTIYEKNENVEFINDDEETNDNYNDGKRDYVIINTHYNKDSIVMLARNGTLKGSKLSKAVEQAIRKAAERNARFVVGDMLGVDTAFIKLLNEIGARYQIYYKDYINHKQVSNEPIQTRLFAKVGDVNEDFLHHNANRLEFHRAILADRTARYRKYPGDKTIKDTAIALKHINWEDNLDAAEAASFRIEAEYMEITIAKFKKRLYGKDSYTDKSALEQTLNDVESRNKLAVFLNNAQTFVKGFKRIETLQEITGEKLTKGEELINQAINRLLNFSADVNKLDATIKSLSRAYFEHVLTPLTGNPEIKLGIRRLFDAQSDENRAQLLMGSIADTNNSFVANFIKNYAIKLGVANRESKLRVEEFNKKLAELGASELSTITKNGDLIQEFDDRYKAKREELYKKVIETELDKGRYSDAYYKAEKEYIEWQYDNLLSEELKQVQRSNIDARDILNSVPEAREAYEKIRDAKAAIKSNHIGVIDISEIDDADIEALKKLDKEEKELRSLYNLNTGEKKTGTALKIAETLNKHSAAIADILNTYYRPIIKNTRYQNALNKHIAGNTEADAKWLNDNTVVKLTDKFWSDYKYYMDILNERINYEDTGDTLLKSLSAYRDADGSIDGRLVSDPVKEKIKSELEGKNEDGYKRAPKAIEKPDSNVMYNDTYYRRYTEEGRGYDSREEDASIVEAHEEIRKILMKYIDANGVLNSTLISISDMERIIKLQDKIDFESSFNHYIDAMRKAFNDWYKETHDTIIDEEAFKEAESMAKAIGRKYYNRWRDINTKFEFTELYYNKLAELAEEHGIVSGNIRMSISIDNINVEALKKVYNVNSFEEFPELIKKQFWKKNAANNRYNALSPDIKYRVFTVGHYLKKHTIKKLDDNGIESTVFHKFDNAEDAAREVFYAFHKELEYETERIRKPLTYQSKVDALFDYKTTAKYERLMKKHGKGSQWYNDNHYIRYDGKILPTPNWTTFRPINENMYNEHAINKKYWGYNEVKDSQLTLYYDERRTEAKEWSSENVNYTNNQYYQDEYAKHKAMSEEEFRDWFDKNHYVNPFNNKLQPLPFWNDMTSTKEYTDEYAPNKDMVSYEIKKQYSNKQEDRDAYNKAVEEHNKTNENKINPLDDLEDPYRSIFGFAMPTKTSGYYNKEFDKVKGNKLYQYLNELLQELINHYDKDTIIDEGKLPIIPDREMSNMPAMKKFIRNIGWFSFPNKEVIGENNENVRILNLPYISQIIEEQEIEAPNKNDFATREEYLKRKLEVDAENRVIRENNKAYTEAHKMKNIPEVIRMFIQAAYKHKFLSEQENEMRIALEEIRNLDMTKKRNLLERLVNVNRERLSKDHTALFEGDSPLATYKGLNSKLETHFKKFMDMIFYDEFELDEGNWTKLARVLQNATSAKGMWLNVPGAFNNVAYGRLQMSLEKFGGYYYTKADSRRAHSDYMSSMISMFADTNKSKASTLTNALIRRFDILELQDELAITTNSEVDNSIWKGLMSVSSFYLLHHIGEHYMQNIGLLSMLRSHRIVGGTIQSLPDYTYNKQYNAIMNVLDDTGKHELHRFIQDNKYKDRYMDGKGDLIRDFILSSSSEITDKFLVELKKIEKESKETFEKLPRLIDAFELQNGKAVFKEGFNLTEEEIEKFKFKTRGVNQKIHGIYNKFDAGTMQQTALGRLIVQFKKWMYPGFTKRYGSKVGSSFWNEHRNEWDTGMYVDTFRFLTKPLWDNIHKNRHEDMAFRDAIGNIFRDYSKYIANMGLYWNTLNDTAKTNIKRTMVEILNFAGIAILLTILKGIAKGRDDEEDKMWAYALYSVDRIKSEAFAFSPAFGFTNETRKIMRDPFAAMAFVDDVLKLTYTAIFERDEYYKGGIYHGDSKLRVQTYKNIPLLNRYLRYDNIQDYAGYYKLY